MRVDFEYLFDKPYDMNAVEINLSPKVGRSLGVEASVADDETSGMDANRTAFVKARKLIQAVGLIKDLESMKRALDEVLADRSLEPMVRAHFLWCYPCMEEYWSSVAWNVAHPRWRNDFQQAIRRRRAEGVRLAEDAELARVVVDRVFGVGCAPLRGYGCVRPNVKMLCKDMGRVERLVPGLMKSLAGTTELAWLRKTWFQRALHKPFLRPRWNALRTQLAAVGIGPETLDGAGLHEADYEELVRCITPQDRYLVIDISSGCDAAYYPISWSDKRPSREERVKRKLILERKSVDEQGNEVYVSRHPLTAEDFEELLGPDLTSDCEYGYTLSIHVSRRKVSIPVLREKTGLYTLEPLYPGGELCVKFLRKIRQLVSLA